MSTLKPVLIAIVFLVFFSLAAQAAIDDGLIAHWSFDACDLQDSGPNGFNAGTLIGNPMCVQGAQGFAFEFYGNDFIRIPDVPVAPTQHSYALWFRPAQDLDSNSPRQDLLYADVDLDVILQTLGRPHITLNHDADGKIGFHPHIIPDNGGNPATSDAIESSTDTWQANRWYHAAFTWDGATFLTYIDGELQQVFDALPSGVSHVYEGIVLAVRGNEEFFFSGSLDEVRMYDRVLTPDEVIQLAVPNPAVLTVMATGSGTGHITSEPSGLNCDSDCDKPYPLGSVVTLTATPDANSVFSGWQGGGCDGVGDCAITLDEDITVVAVFEQLDSACEVVANDGEVMSFDASSETVRLPKRLHKTLNIAAAQAGYWLLLYEWYGSETPFEAIQGTVDLAPDTRVKKVKCEALEPLPPDPGPGPGPEPSSPCEVTASDGEVMGFDAGSETVKLPKHLQKTLDIAATQAGYLLSLYEWYGSETPFEEVQGEINLAPGTQVKKVKCEAL